MEKGGGEWRASDGCKGIDRKIAERMVVGLKGRMRHGQRIETEIWGK